MIGDRILKAGATHLSLIRAHVKAGELTLDLVLGDQVIATGHRITTTPTDIVIDPPIPARLADQIRPVITDCAGSGLMLNVITDASA